MYSVSILEVLADFVDKLVKTDNSWINLMIAVLVTAAFLILFFNFFLRFNPIWKKERQSVRIEAVTKQNGGNFEIDPYYFAKVHVDGQTRHLICDRKTTVGQEVDVFYSPDMIIKNKNYNLSVGRIWIFLFITGASGCLVNAWMTQTVLYFGCLLILWLVYPPVYKLYYTWMMNRFLETVELEESGEAQSNEPDMIDYMNYDIMENAPESAKKAVNGFLVLLLFSIVALMLYAICLVIKFLWF